MKQALNAFTPGAFGEYLTIRWLVALVLIICAGTSSVCGDDSATGADLPPVEYFLVITGGELLEGAYPDGHTPFLTRTLRALGARCAGSILVDDSRADIQRALRFATNRASLVLITGGLGPTPNDITRETLSDFTRIPLVEQPEALAEMERRFGESRDQLRPNLRRQILVPAQGSYFRNPHGTALGLVFDATNATFIALPGPPRELQAITRDEVIPFLQKRFGVRAFGSSVTLRFVGVGQSLIDQTLKDQVRLEPDILVTSLFDSSRVDFTFALPGHSPADQDRLRTLNQKIRAHLSDFIYADDGSSLEAVVLNQIRSRNSSLAIVEIGSAGALTAALNAAPGSRELLAGTFVAPNEAAAAKLLDMATDSLPKSPLEQLKALASEAASRTKSGFSLTVGSLQTGDRGPSGVGLACRFPDGHWITHLLPIRDSAEINRSSLTTQILDFLRRELR